MNGKKVLVVDDSSIIRGEVRQLLKDIGIDSVEAKDSVGYFYALEDYDGQIGLIIMDLMLYDKSGYDLISKTKEMDNYKDIPFVILTAHGDMENIIKGKMLDVADFIIKPFDRIKFVTRIKRILDNQ